ncbi:MAG: DNA-directed RNA polymerase subunit alpha [candidate division WOR-3 bacterium]|nr:DNA-directed RNA polymerase subunit alpha [candidate division WOR-3 bacterium]
MVLKPLVMPKSIEIDKETISDVFGRFIISPLERGYGITIGNAMRRVLLSSIQGAAITNLRISNVTQEFSTIPGVYEDVVEIILNLKKIRVKLLGGQPTTLVLKVKGKKDYYAEDIEKNPNVLITNPRQKILTVTDAKTNFTMEMTVETGRGFVPAELLKKPDAPVGTIFIDAIFSPVLSVNFDVRNTRVGTKTDYDHLVLEVKTDGTITPIEAVVEAASLLRHHFSFFVDLGKPYIALDESTQKTLEEIRNNINKRGLQLYVEPLFTSREQLDAEHRRIRDMLKRSIDELEISVRTSNCLKNKNIKTIGDLVRKSGKELLTYDNFGRKSLKELEKILHNMGLHLEMDVDRFLKEDI